MFQCNANRQVKKSICQQNMYTFEKDGALTAQENVLIFELKIRKLYAVFFIITLFQELFS
jgi:hypothetical protein